MSLTPFISFLIYWATAGLILVWIDRDFHNWDKIVALVIFLFGGILLPLRVFRGRL